MSKIILIKNFDSIADNQLKLVGKYNSELNPNQKENIDNIKNLIIEHKIKKFHICFYGDQLQSMMTIDILKERFPNFDFNLCIQNEKLNDIDYGNMSFQCKLDIMNQDSGEYTLYRITNDINFDFPGGDSIKSKFKEIYTFYEKTIKKIINEKINILIITSDLNIKFLKMICKNYTFDEINLETFIYNENECLSVK
jgi:bisphosphoglycerate-dependent phosphoglycerate mutase